MAKKKLPVGFYERSNGKLMYQFTVEGKRYSVYGATIKECRAKELEKRQAIEEKMTEIRKGLTVEAYLDNWIEYRISVGAIKEQTARTYGKILNRIKRTVIDKDGTRFGDIRLKELEARHCKELQKALTKDCVIKDKNGKPSKQKGLTTRTVNDSLSLLKKAMEAAKNERIIQWNPCDTVERLKRSEEPARDTIHRCLTEEELRAFFEAAGENWYYHLFQFLLYTGMRIGEASALYTSDIKGNIANVNKTVTRTESGYIIGDQTKTEAGRRTVPLRPEARQAIDNQRAVYKLINGDKVVEINKPLFRMPKGNIIRPDRVNTEISKICEKAGIEKFTCHAFRATFTSRCVADGMPVKELMEILGHTDVKMTLGLYAHSNEELKMEKLLAVNI